MYIPLAGWYKYCLMVIKISDKMIVIFSENNIRKYLVWNKQSRVKENLWSELKLFDPSVYLKSQDNDSLDPQLKAIAVCTLTLTFSGCHWKAWSHHLQLHNKPITILVLVSLPHIQNLTKVARCKREPFNGRVHLHNVPEQIFSNRTERFKSQSATGHNEEIYLSLQKICSCHLDFLFGHLNNFIKYVNVSESLQSFICGLLSFLLFPFDSLLFMFQALGLALSYASSHFFPN